MIPAWLGWKAVTGFFKVQWKWLVILLVLILLLLGAWKISSIVAENKANRDKKEETIAILQEQRNQAVYEALSAQESLRRERVNKQLIEELRQDYLQAKSDIRQELRAEMEIFTKKRKYTWEEMVTAKPGLIQTRINNASQEYYDEMAALFND
jgi:cell division protein YceG involved in septum cleavage